MKKLFVLLVVSIIVSITFVCFNYNKTESKPAPNKIKSSVKEDKIVSINKKYYSSVVSYICHDDYYEYVKKDDIKNSDVIFEEEIYNTSEEIVEEINSYESKESTEDMVNNKKQDEQVIDVEIKKLDDTKDNVDEVAQIIEENVIELEEKDEETNKIEGDDDILKVTSEINATEVVSESNINTNDELENLKKESLGEIIKGYYSPSGKYLGDSKVKVIDVSYYQGDINWDLFASESDCYGVILRLGYYDTLDKNFEQNISELKRLNIPYGIYLFSYATTMKGSDKEADFTNQMIDEYDLKPTLGIYYDIESWNAKNGATSDVITKNMYDNIISNYINKVSNYVNSEYKVKVYSGRWYAMNRLGALSKSYVDWVAEYNSICKYDGNYSMWQYTSKGSVPGITGNVDISYLY